MVSSLILFYEIDKIFALQFRYGKSFPLSARTCVRRVGEKIKKE